MEQFFGLWLYLLKRSIFISAFCTLYNPECKIKLILHQGLYKVQTANIDFTSRITRAWF